MSCLRIAKTTPFRYGVMGCNFVRMVNMEAVALWQMQDRLTEICCCAGLYGHGSMRLGTYSASDG